MPHTDFRALRIVQHLDEDLKLARVLLFPKTCFVGDNIDKLRSATAEQIRHALENVAPVAVHRHQMAGEPEWRGFVIDVEAPRNAEAWKSPLILRFDVLLWPHGEDAFIAQVPALGIDVVGHRREPFDEQIATHIRLALMRQKALDSLRALERVQRTRQLKIEPFTIHPTLPTPKQSAMAEDDDAPKKSVLREVGILVGESQHVHRWAYEIESTTAQVADLLTRRRGKSVLLVGPSGVGKTACVYDLARHRRKHNVVTNIFSVSGSRLIAGMSGFGMWQERCRQLWQEATKEKAILHLGNLVELMQVGKSEHNHQGIASFLRPYIGRGDFRVIAECTPEQIPVIEREDPHLLDAFATVDMHEPSEATAKAILFEVAASRARPGRAAPLEIDALETLDRLHRRYATYSAYPGRPVRFLRNILDDRDPRRPIEIEDVIAAFSRETGLPRVLLDPKIPLDLAATREWFSARVIGQEQAVDLIVDLLAMVKAVMTRPRKPIASLMFIGPTGVGKTEMAKALAEFLFQDRTRITRFDMSEYADPISVQRLIGGVFGSEGLLTARVRENPFAVVLFDEVEKAHPQFFDTLLQVLGEGRLTDASGRVADFCNTVIIMTSNLGAESFRQGAIGFGGGSDARKEAHDHFMNEVKKFVRPEMFNRIDRIVPFLPLPEDVALKITARELDLVRQRDGIKYRGVDLALGQAVARHLLAVGFDARYGARPLKRAIDRHLLVPLAEKLNGFSVENAVAATAEIGTENGAESATASAAQISDAIAIDVGTKLDAQGRAIPAAMAGNQSTGSAMRAMEQRRRTQALLRSPDVVGLGNDVYRLQRRRERLERQRLVKSANVDMREVVALPAMEGLWGRIQQLSENVTALEDRMLLSLYGELPATDAAAKAEFTAIEAEWKNVLLALLARRYADPNVVTLAVYGESPAEQMRLATFYFSFATHVLQGRASVFTIDFPEPRTEGAPLEIKELKEPERGLYTVGNVVGVLFRIDAPLAFPRLAPERGIHEFRTSTGTFKCLVETTDALPDKYKPPKNIERKGSIGTQDRRRTYDFTRDVFDDVALKSRGDIPNQKFDELLARLIDQRLMTEANRVIEA